MPVISSEYWENFIAVLLGFSVLSLIIERALYQIFDSKVWGFVEKRLDKQVGEDFLDIKPWIASLLSIAIVFKLDLDIIAMIFNMREPSFISMVVTGLFIAGGSTGIFKFFKRARKLKQAIYEQKVRDNTFVSDD
ncbi:hypothetical protein [Desulfonema magnum]|uniref:Uncharacterized protein n=1 Tax=Desulfonema magnum TaxID=45655 RepID=A0A975BP70_9BACT|nr:hypothetical protein [Desulfonema magnum]QTA88803.1 Uncharacterized protein dnm_048500 [Desulfonema magnum]